jgi:hypothetical protein
MADERNLPETIATLNEAIDILGALKSGSLGKLLSNRLEREAEGCDYACGCNQSMCGCRGSVKAREMEAINFTEFMAIREARLAELKREVEALNVPSELK